MIFEVIMTSDKETPEEVKEEVKEGFDFEAIEKANAEKKKKAAEDRLRANQRVLKGYRIK